MARNLRSTKRNKFTESELGLVAYRLMHGFQRYISVYPFK